MRFEDFARMHGLIFNSIIPYKWVSTPTVDHPRSGNGRYKYMGDVGFVQNWATMEKPAVWKPDENYRPTAELTRAKNQAVAEREELATKAASKAGWILHQCTMKPHPYLEKKGFPDEEGNVWEADGGSKLVIPMRMNNRLVGCQLIDEEGNKKFLYGQRTKGASFSFADKLDNVFLCEGYATGLSIRHIMKANSMRYTIHVCFSAGNMKEVARSMSDGIIIADNDPSHVGETIAKETGKPYWLSDTVGEDFNDYHMRVGLFKASQALKKLLVQQKSGAVYSSNK